MLFKTSFGNCDIYITDKGLSYVFLKYEEDEEKGKKKKDFEPKFGKREQEENKKVSYYRLDMDLVGASIDKTNIIKEAESKQGHSNYFYAHCPEGIYDVKAYGKITIKNIYKGIDWVIYTNSNSKEHPLKYDFVVHPDADYKTIKIKFLNAQNTTLEDEDTKLKIQTIAGNIEEGSLYSYTTPLCHAERSEASHTKTQTEIKNLGITSKYIITKDSIIQFEIANYDTTKTLIIDPLVWATYYGGNGDDEFYSICVDSQDNIYITGYTESINFPIQQLTGAYWQATNTGGADIIILKFNEYGVRQWAIYYGGSGYDCGASIYPDSQDNLYIVGYTGSIDFSTQQLTGAYWQGINAGGGDAFILKFNNQGVRKWATYYGGNGSDGANSICLDSQGNIYIVGNAQSINFPLQQLVGAYWQGVNAGGGDIFILKFNNQGVRQWATYYGGSNGDIAIICVDNQDNIYITGSTDSQDFPTQQLAGAYNQTTNTGIGFSDAFILKFNNQGVRQWATYYGGNGSDGARSICIDSQDNIYITGITNSQNFSTKQLTGAYNQVTNAAYDAFILKLNNQCIRKWATYYGGSGDENGESICVDSQDNIYITGYTGSTDFPTQQLAGEYWQPTNSGNINTFILKFNNQDMRQWATYYTSNGGGSSGRNIVTDNQNSIYSTGEWLSSGIYTIDYGNGAYYDDSWNGSNDSYIFKIIPVCNNQKPISLQSNRNNICINDNGNITLTAIGGIGDTLRWYSGSCGQNYIGKHTPLIIPSPTQTITYYARWESSCDSSACDSITINVNPIKQTIINPVICQGEKYQVGIHNYTTAGTYTEILTSYLGCDSTVATNLTVKPLPIVNLGSGGEICEGDTIELSVNSDYTTYLWQDGSTNNSFLVSQVGTYWVTVNYNDCIQSDTVRYYVCANDIKIWIPNSFTPNGDGLNDEFKIETIAEFSKFQMSIYNRWGQLIFESKDAKNGWDGKFNGELVPIGVYTYNIEYMAKENKQAKRFSGRVTVVM